MKVHLTVAQQPPAHRPSDEDGDDLNSELRLSRDLQHLFSSLPSRRNKKGLKNRDATT